MEDAQRATLLYTQELLVTLIKRMAAAGILSEDGSIALATEVAESAKVRAPELAKYFDSHSQGVVDGVKAACTSIKH